MIIAGYPDHDLVAVEEIAREPARAFQKRGLIINRFTTECRNRVPVINFVLRLNLVCPDVVRQESSPS